jgi:hypothetical protein
LKRGGRGSSGRNSFIKLKCNHRYINIRCPKQAPINSARKPLMRIKRKKKSSILVEMQRQVPESKHAKETKEKGLYPPAYPNPILFVQHLQSKRQASQPWEQATMIIVHPVVLLIQDLQGAVVTQFSRSKTKRPSIFSQSPSSQSPRSLREEFLPSITFPT